MATLDKKQANSEGPKDPWSRLLEKVGKHQDREAFHALFEHFGPQIKYFAMANGLSSHAEELVQEVFVSIWRRSCLYDWRKAAASTWIFTIARNQRIDMLRKMQRTSAEMNVETEDLWQVPGDNEDEPVTSLHRLMSERRIRESLGQLSEEQTTVIAKVYMENKSHQRVADELNIPLGTVKSRVRLALNKLKVILQDQNA
ncbi:MAG: sigma-70 family RNA polymerase sigma factor [Gammaproteobacteria bacterium]|uniref:RNA polymerase sigma factor n=1 Tax=Marinobacter nitratireducens TaxID=1137280 RepID=A0A072NB19_9GAMM|nr:RNA polymerase sigma-70 factor, ECF subfamily [Marinobacter nitratireducens]TNE74826.1 MAG: sigma-70 family RNA polymerase sigma factor [Gammaproteobacteria bacterium]TNE94925.1 MAG: sigma-70 family RNA polymerase sigma factor [Gammaproteobacteria bacterium]